MLPMRLNSKNDKLSRKTYINPPPPVIKMLRSPSCVSKAIIPFNLLFDSGDLMYCSSISILKIGIENAGASASDGV